MAIASPKKYTRTAIILHWLIAIAIIAIAIVDIAIIRGVSVF